MVVVESGVVHPDDLFLFVHEEGVDVEVQVEVGDGEYGEEHYQKVQYPVLLDEHPALLELCPSQLELSRPLSFVDLLGFLLEDQALALEPGG